MAAALIRSSTCPIFRSTVLTSEILHGTPFCRLPSQNKFNSTKAAVNRNVEDETVRPIKYDFERLENIHKSGEIPKKFNFARDIFDYHAETRPSDLALWFDNDVHFEKKWSFSNLRTESKKASIVLQSLLPTWTPKEHQSYVLTILPRVPEWWFFHLAAIRVGTIFSPGTTMLTTEDIIYRIQTSAARVIITDEANMGKVDAAQKALGDHPVARNLKKVLVGPYMSYSLDSSWIHYDNLVKDISTLEAESFQNKDTDSMSYAQAFFTSGTTGKPKMVAHTQVSYGLGHHTTAKLMGLKSTDIHWNISDPGWAKSSYANFFTPWIAGAAVYIHQMEKFEAQKIMEVLHTKPITTFCAPPTLYKSLLQVPDENLFKLKSLRYAVGGGEPLNPEVTKKWQEKTGIRLHELYGQTETTGIGTYPDSAYKEGSLGIPTDDYTIKIVDDDGKIVSPGDEGHIGILSKPKKPIGLFAGYLKAGENGPELDVEKTDSCFRGDYYVTGDRGYMDEEGYLYFVSRADDVIISAGYRIGPFEVESVIQTHPAVVENAAVASPDQHRGEVVKAFIVLTEEYKKSEDLDKLAKEIQDYVKTHTAPYKYPRKIEFVDALPKTVSGKVLRRELKRKEFEQTL